MKLLCLHVNRDWYVYVTLSLCVGVCKKALGLAIEYIGGKLQPSADENLCATEKKKTSNGPSAERAKDTKKIINILL